MQLVQGLKLVKGNIPVFIGGLILFSMVLGALMAPGVLGKGSHDKNSQL